jgi:single-strand DNA-binding protein
MAKNVNKVTLVGQLGKDPEMRYIPSGKAVTSASMATTRSWKVGEEWKEETQWHSLELWGDAAEAFNAKCKKGDKVYIEGMIKYEQWEAEGVKHNRTKINVDTWIWLASGKNGNSQPETEGTEIPILPE